MRNSQPSALGIRGRFARKFPEDLLVHGHFFTGRIPAYLAAPDRAKFSAGIAMPRRAGFEWTYLIVKSA